MRRFSIFLTLVVGLTLLASSSPGQPPNGQPPKGKKGGGPKGQQGMPDAAMVDDIVARMMAFDANKDGKLTRDEITDARLLRLFDRSVTNKDGSITKEEMIAVAKQMVGEVAAEGGGGPGGKGEKGGKGPGGKKDKGGPGGKGDPGGFGGGSPGKGGPGGGGIGGGGFGGPPAIGQILPTFALDLLKLTDDQKKQVESLQSDVNTKLDNILTDDQKNLLKEMRDRVPGGPKGLPPKGTAFQRGE